MSERATMATTFAKESSPGTTFTPGTATGAWERYGMALVVFLLLLLGYMLSFSFDENDSLDTAYWMEKHDFRLLLEFRHLLQRMLPLWLWHFLGFLHVDISALGLLNLWDFATAALSVMLLYRLLLDMVGSRPLAFGGSFAYATAHCVWIYTGSGRLYSTSMLLVFAAYYLGLQMDKLRSERSRWVVTFAAATFICFASLFWLVHVFSAISVGLLLVFLPKEQSWFRRFGYLTLFSATGIILTLVIAVSCLTYVQIPLERHAIKAWMDVAGTQPMQFDALSPMKAAFGQAHGILVMYQLPYMINGFMLKDPHLRQLGSFPWQLGKFLFIWILLALVYLYPLAIFRKASRHLKLLIAILYIPLAVNMYFALGWLGSDVQRFMPTMLSQFGLGAIAVQDLLRRVSRPRIVAGVLMACLAFIAADNLVQSLLPSQRNHIVLAQAMKSIRPYTRPTDLLMNFGRDLPISYQTQIRFYGGAMFVTMTNDPPTFAWDLPNWDQNFDRIWQATRQKGGRVFVMDRVAEGFNPVQAAWSEKQHSRPTVKQYSNFLRTNYCVIPAFYVGSNRYYQIAPREPACPPTALQPETEARK